jgi:activator of HSP90 ATPase
MEFILKTNFNTTAKKIYETWLSSEGHTKMTGGSAIISDKIGDKFIAWDGYIEGENIDLEPNKRIFQTWRTSQFDKNEEDSQIEVLLDEVNGKTEFTLIHTNLPESGEQYKQGWEDHYFEPMRKYFSE